MHRVLYQTTSFAAEALRIGEVRPADGISGNSLKMSSYMFIGNDYRTAVGEVARVEFLVVAVVCMVHEVDVSVFEAWQPPVAHVNEMIVDLRDNGAWQ